DDVTVVPLNRLTLSDAVDRTNAHLVALQRAEAGDEKEASEQLTRTCTATLDWLWHAVAEPVLAALGSTAAPGGAPWPRLWGYATGPLTLLPLHAAASADGSAAVLDRAVSSYTPTLAALLRAGSGARPSDERLLAVGMPTTAGAAPLPATTAELAMA